LQRREQKGPFAPANQSPARLHVGHLTFIASKRNITCRRSPNCHGRLIHDPGITGPDSREATYLAAVGSFQSTNGGGRERPREPDA
jgi:hypothetical protein